MKILSLISNYKSFKGELNIDGLIILKEKQKVNGRDKMVEIGTQSINDAISQFKKDIIPYGLIRAQIMERIENDGTFKWKTIKNFIKPLSLKNPISCECGNLTYFHINNYIKCTKCGKIKILK